MGLRPTQLHRYLRFVKPAFDNFVSPSSKFADIVCNSFRRKATLSQLLKIVPGSGNAVAIDLISTHIRRKLKDRYVYLRPKIARGLSGTQQTVQDHDQHLDPSNIMLLHKTCQLNVVITLFLVLIRIDRCLVGHLYYSPRQDDESQRLHILYRSVGYIFGREGYGNFAIPTKIGSESHGSDGRRKRIERFSEMFVQVQYLEVLITRRRYAACLFYAREPLDFFDILKLHCVQWWST